MASSRHSDKKTESLAYNTLLKVMLSDSIPAISVRELSSHQDQYTILDAREPEEFEVSRLPGATHVGFEDFTFESLPDISKESPIVVYCSVGYRSEKIGERLTDAGFSNVRNLYGGIFEWVNQGQTLVCDGGTVSKIHPYNTFWSTWITNDSITVTTTD
jgi:rhodanese-related sulfurtransferase